MRKTVSGIMLTLLLTSMLMLAFNIQPVKADGTSATVAKPPVVSRTEWGCPDGQNSPGWPPEYYPVTHIMIHHTATTNDAIDWTTEVYNIWEYHANTKGWGDIGYNYLIDPNGVIYEGRAGGNDVIAAHAAVASGESVKPLPGHSANPQPATDETNYNDGSMGIAFLGTFSEVKPSSAALRSAEALIAWKCAQRVIAPLGSGPDNDGIEYPYINGHRDVEYTACPGDELYNLLPTIRQNVFNIMKAGWGESHNVAVIDDYYGSAVGYLYPSDYPDQTFSTLSASQVSAETLANYDTVILFMFNPNGLTAAQKAAIDDWVYKGGKLMIWDSDQVPPGYPWDYTWLPYPFTTSTPGQTGAHTGKLEVMEENQLSSSDSSSPYYVDTDALVHYTDAVGDATVLITYSPGWRIDMMATNVLGETGPALVYAAYGSGLMIYSALDWDYAGYWSGWDWSNSGVWLKKLLKQELECSYLPFVAPPVPGEVGLEVEVTSEAPEGYYTDKPINFKATVTNPTDQTGINIIAYNVELNIIVPEEIEVDTTTATVGNIGPGESKTVTFSGNMKKAGENVEVIVNARGEDHTLWKTIAGSGSCFINVHDPEAPEADWSFAIITDLHIGYGRGLQLVDSDSDSYRVEYDYGKFGWDDSELLPQEGNYEITDRLASAIDKIIAEKGYYNIKFVVVLGDISDTAEKSEFFKARELLNRLNDHDIPYIPLIGNHDVWPYTQDVGKHHWWESKGTIHSADDRGYYASIAQFANGDEFFKEVFWGDSNSRNIKLIENIAGDSWQYTYDKPVHIKGGLVEGCVYNFELQDSGGNKFYDVDDKDCISQEHDFYLMNYGFTYNGITFVCLDLAPRLGEDHDPGDGNAIPGSLKGGFATSHPETQKFSKDYFTTHPSSKKIAVLFSHYELGDGIFNYVNPLPENFVQDYEEIFNFYGHWHELAPVLSTENYYYYYYPDKSHGEYIYVHEVGTEDVANIDLFHGVGRTGNPIRIVQVKGDPLECSTLLAPTEKVDIQWLYPDFAYTYASYPEPNKEITFTAYCTSYHGFKMSFDWDFGDGSFGSGSSVKHSYAQEGVYNVTLTVTTKNLITGEETSQTVIESVYVHSKHVISPLPSDLYATSPLTGEDLTQVPQNTYEPVLIAKEGSEETPVTFLGVHFEEAIQNIDLSSLIADVDLEEGKSVIYMPTWPEEIDQYKQLYIPSTGVGAVYICLDATSLDDVSLENADVILNVGETKEGITVTTTFYNGSEYYLVSAVTGTGGGELKDTIPPTTLLTIGEPKYVTDITYVTPDTPFNLTATDNPGGTGVAITAYKIRSATYDSGWLTYTEPFRLTGLIDGVYSIDYNSTDNAKNVEPTNTINVTLFSWNYVFTDSYGRGTTLKINLPHKFFQFITPYKDYGIRKATYMKQCGRAIIIQHCDSELRLITVAVDTKLDFCFAMAWDLQTRKCYLLIDKAGIEK